VRFGTVVPLVTARALGGREFTYELPDGAHKGAVVTVPFGRSRARGVVVEVVEAPQIEGADTMGTHRVLQTIVNGKPSSGEIYNYIASFGTFLVIVTANPLVLPDKPVAPVDTQRAQDLLSATVAAVKG